MKTPAKKLRPANANSAADQKQEKGTAQKWNWIRLADLAETRSGATPPRGTSRYYGGSIPWVKTGELRDNLIESSDEYVTDAAVRETSLKLLPKGTVLIAMYGQGQTRGRTGILACEATTNQACFAILPNDRFDPSFMQLWFRASYSRLRQMTENRGGNQPNLNGDVLREELVPLPPLTEQRRIAARLKEELAEVVRARAAVAAQLKAAQLLPAALLRDVFQRSDAKMWPIKPFGEVVDNFDGQRVPLNLSDRQKRQGDYPYYGASGIIDHIDDYRFDGEFLLIGEDGANLLARSTPIAFAAAGKFWVNNHAHVVRPKQGVRLDWLRHYFASIDLSPFVSGSAQPKLSQESLNTIPTPVPMEAVQSELIRKLNSELVQHETLSNSIQSRLDTIEKLPASLLRNAFPTVS